MTNKKALEVLSSWLAVAYQNTYGTDESSAELYEALQTVFALINHQKEEIEFLRKTMDKNAKRALDVTLEEIEKSRVEAITEFAERLKENITKSINNYWNNDANGYYLAEDVLDEIDILVKEMIGDTE